MTPAQDGCVVVFDEQSDEQDQTVITELASRLSREFGCPVLAVLNHDDDIFWYQLYLAGELADEYDSSPGYFDPSAEPSAPAGGDAQKLCSAFGACNVAEVESVLRKPDVYVAPLGEGMNREAARLARELRRHGLVVELGDETFRLKKSFEAADKLGARFVLIVGENEVKADAFALKRLGTSEQVTVPRGELAGRISSP